MSRLREIFRLLVGLMDLARVDDALECSGLGQYLGISRSSDVLDNTARSPL